TTILHTAERVKQQRAEEARAIRSQALARGLEDMGWITRISLRPHPPRPHAKHNLSKGNLEASWTDFATRRPPPFLILFPSTTKEVSEIMKICHKRRLPVTAFSGGTSLEAILPYPRGVVIDFQRMDKILKIHDKDLDAIVQPAVGWEYLNEELMKIIFSSSDQPRGDDWRDGRNWMFRDKCSEIWDNEGVVISLTVVLADGTVVKTRQRPRKSSAGYDLTRMFIVVRNTGLVTEITLKLAYHPGATDVVEKIVAQGIQVAAVELLDDVQMKCINDAGGLVKEIINKTSQKAGFEFAKNAEEAAELWEARKEALWSVIALKKTQHDHHQNPKVWTTDVAVPVSRLSDIEELGEETVDAMRKLKLAFDPLCLLNCDKVIRMEKKTSQH
ncbi:hypothetical protein BGX38DRAFT_1246352, partial [Terfezia claveryi]